MNIALIGGTGGIGRQVLARALELGHDVRVLLLQLDDARYIRFAPLASSLP